MLLTDSLVVYWRNTSAVVDDLDSFKTVVLEAHLYIQYERDQPVGNMTLVPMLVAPASRLFSTSSLTAVCKSITT